MTLALRNLQPRDTTSLSSLRPEVEESLRLVLLRYHIPELDAESLLRETILEVLYKAEGPLDFGRRVGPVLQAKCRIYWQTRRWRCFNTLAESRKSSPEPVSAALQPPTSRLQPERSQPEEMARNRGSLRHRLRTVFSGLER